jgi:exonuclease VII small subunit
MSELQFDKKLKKLKNDVAKYEKLPDSKRIGNIYTDLEKRIKECREIISEYSQNVELARAYEFSKDSIDKVKIDFEAEMDELKTLFTIIDDDELSVDDMVQLYTELCVKAQICKEYVSNQICDIEKVD